MTKAGWGFPHWWASVEPGRVVNLASVRAGRPEPDLGIPAAVRTDVCEFPAVVRCRIGGGAIGERTDYVMNLLAQVERTALTLFPRWLPDAALFEGPGGGTIPAVRALATRIAAASEHYGPYFADLAEQALRMRGHLPRTSADRMSAALDPAAGEPDFALPCSRHPARVRAAELARVVAEADGRRSAAMLIELSVDLAAGAERALMDAAAWIAYHGSWRVGLMPASVVEQGDTATGPEQVHHLSRAPAPAHPPSALSDAASAAAVLIPKGVPRPDSPAECALEAALCFYPWAAGRVWNQTYQSNLLAPVFRLDLWWPVKSCVVEIDGPEHRSAAQYAADRRRDVQLHLDGQTVLRFTNDDVLTDVSAVVAQIERFLRHRPR